MTPKFKTGDKVVCVDAELALPGLVLGHVYIVKAEAGRTVRLIEVPGEHLACRFNKVVPDEEVLQHSFPNKFPPMPVRRKHNPIKSVKVNEEHIKACLTAFVQDRLGIDATVTDIIVGFQNAVELVLGDEA